jgi:hypothetical protein
MVDGISDNNYNKHMKNMACIFSNLIITNQHNPKELENIFDVYVTCELAEYKKKLIYV